MGTNWACSIAKAKRKLGYTPMVSLEEGVRRTLLHFAETGETRTPTS
jgi:nucleoside-diphosphate-sugar epimerase